MYSPCGLFFLAKENKCTSFFWWKREASGLFLSGKNIDCVHESPFPIEYVIHHVLKGNERSHWRTMSFALSIYSPLKSPKFCLRFFGNRCQHIGKHFFSPTLELLRVFIVQLKPFIEIKFHRNLLVSWC